MANKIDKLFYKPEPIRDEPKVEVAYPDVASQISSLDIEDKAKFVNELKLLASGWDLVAYEYGMFVDVIKKRAKAIDYLYTPEPTIELANAIKTLYNKDIKEFTYDDYIDLVTYEHEIYSVFGQKAYNGEQVTAPTKEIGAISVLKTGFHNDFNNKELEWLSLPDTYIDNQYTAGSGKAAIHELLTSQDGQKFEEGFQDSKLYQKLKPFLDECIPCAERTLYSLEDFKRNMSLNRFLTFMYQSMLANLQQLAKQKLFLYDNILGSYMCQIINVFKNRVCLPDLGALTAVITYMIMQIKNAISKLGLTTGGLLVGIATAIVHPIIDAIETVLLKILSAAFSPVDCILTSLNVELQKIYPAIDFAAGKKEYWRLNTEGASAIFSDLFTKIRQARAALENEIYSYIDELEQSWEKKLSSENETLDLYSELDRYRVILSIIKNIIDIAKMKALKNRFDSNAFYKEICSNAVQKVKPWIQSTPIVNGLPNVYVRNQNPGDTIGDITDGLIFTDPTLPTNFFDGPDIIDYLDNPLVQDAIDKNPYDDDIEEGPHPFALDPTFLDAYKNKRDSAKIQMEKAIQSQKFSKTQFASYPVGSIDFSACLSEDISDEKLHEWINKIKG